MLTECLVVIDASGYVRAECPDFDADLEMRRRAAAEIRRLAGCWTYAEPGCTFRVARVSGRFERLLAVALECGLPCAPLLEAACAWCRAAEFRPGEETAS